MPPMRTAQHALMSLPTLAPTPLYEPVRITQVTATLVRADNGRTFRRNDLSATEYTEDERRAGNFVARLIPDTHPYYPKAHHQHVANQLRTAAIGRIRQWQRYPYSHTTARTAANALEELADHLDPED